MVDLDISNTQCLERCILGLSKLNAGTVTVLSDRETIRCYDAQGVTIYSLYVKSHKLSILKSF